MDNLIAKLFKSPKTVFSVKDLVLIWGETNQNNLKAKTAYYVKQGSLIRLTRGVFAKDNNYNIKELATSLYAPSYISFETALREAGIIFQYFETVFVAGPWSFSKKIGRHSLTFRKLKETVLFSPAGIKNENNYCIAGPERAFLDTLYLFPGYYFDNLSSINWELAGELARIYDNRQLVKRLNQYQKKHAE